MVIITALNKHKGLDYMPASLIDVNTVLSNVIQTLVRRGDFELEIDIFCTMREPFMCKFISKW